MKKTMDGAGFNATGPGPSTAAAGSAMSIGVGASSTGLASVGAEERSRGGRYLFTGA